MTHPASIALPQTEGEGTGLASPEAPARWRTNPAMETMRSRGFAVTAAAVVGTVGGDADAGDSRDRRLARAGALDR